MKNKKSISLEEVKHVAKLAKLDLTEELLVKFQKQISAIVDLVSKVQEVDTNGVEPTSQVTGLENVLREDIIKPSLTQEEALINAQRKHNGYFVADAVFNE